MREVILIVAACIGLVTISVGCSGDTKLEIRTETGVAAAIALTESHINSLVTSMAIMAITDEVRSGDWAKMVDLLSKFKQDQIPAAVWFVIPDGSYFTVSKGKTTSNLKDRNYFPSLMAGNIQIGDLVVSKSTGQKSMIAAVPVKDRNKVIGALGVSVFLDKFSEIVVAELQLPDDTVLFAVNAQGQIALHSDTELILNDASTLSSHNEVSKISSLTGWRFTLIAKD